MKAVNSRQAIARYCKEQCYAKTDDLQEKCTVKQCALWPARNIPSEKSVTRNINAKCYYDCEFDIFGGQTSCEIRECPLQKYRASLSKEKEN